MLLPGPEAMQLATYVGWRLHGLKGGLAAGLLFVLPGAAVVLTLSMLYAGLGKLPVAEALFVGVKAAVLAIVVEALLRVGQAGAEGHVRLADRDGGLRRHLLPQGAVPADRHRGGLGWLLARRRATGCRRAQGAPVAAAATLRTALAWLAIWIVPLLAVAAVFGRDHVLTRDRLVLLQARRGDVRRRLRGAGLHGPGRRRALSAGCSPARCSTASASPRRRPGR